MKIYVIVTEAKVHTYTSWARATQVSLRSGSMFPKARHLVVQTVTQKRKATLSDKAVTEQMWERSQQSFSCCAGPWALKEHQ